MPTTTHLDFAVGHRLLELRLGKGLSQEAVAQRSGVDLDRLALLEAGSASATLTDIAACAGALGAHVVDIMLPALVEVSAVAADEGDPAAWGLELNRNAFQVHDRRGRALLMACATALASSSASPA